MLSLGYPKLNFQLANGSSRQQLLAEVKKYLDAAASNSAAGEVDEISLQQKEKAYQVNFKPELGLTGFFPDCVVENHCGSSVSIPLRRRVFLLLLLLLFLLRLLRLPRRCLLQTLRH